MFGTIWKYITTLYSKSYLYCKKNFYPDEFFLTACRNGDLEEVKRMDENFTDLPYPEGMRIASIKGYGDILEYIIKSYLPEPVLLDECMKIACENNKYFSAEILAKNKANITVGIKSTNSTNIIRMLYRHKLTPDGNDNIT